MVIDEFMHRRAKQISDENQAKARAKRMQELADGYKKPAKTKAELALED